MKRRCTAISCCLAVAVFVGCSTPKVGGLFGSKTPHEKYQSGLQAAGLGTTRLGRLWTEVAANSLLRPVKINLPYKETGYFEMQEPSAASYKFTVKQGEKVTLSVLANPQSGVLLFSELWEINGSDKKLLASGDTTTHAINHEIKKSGDYLVRLQPELLQGVAYTITITTAPSLAFPVNAKDNPRVMSIWGDSRDANARRHEGIDIFAKKYTPVMAIADGYVSSVSENKFGGKVVFLRPQGNNINLYYAHLDTQLVQSGVTVKVGDTLGLIGNTGNAKFTPAHLHFGIYTNGGAVDPYPFVNFNRPSPKPVKADTTLLTNVARTKASTTIFKDAAGKEAMQKLPAESLLKIVAAVDDMYKVALPDNNTGFVSSNSITTKTARQQTLKQATDLLDRPAVSAAVKRPLAQGDMVNILGSYNDWLYVSSGVFRGWIKL